jgi:hypothetical protein
VGNAIRDLPKWPLSTIQKTDGSSFGSQRGRQSHPFVAVVHRTRHSTARLPIGFTANWTGGLQLDLFSQLLIVDAWRRIAITTPIRQRANPSPAVECCTGDPAG